MERREAWREENERRRHNYVPFIIEALRRAAGAGKLQGMYEVGRKRAGEGRERARAQKKAAAAEAAAAAGAGT